MRARDFVKPILVSFAIIGFAVFAYAQVTTGPGITGGSGTPGGATGSVQWNNNGTMAGAPAGNPGQLFTSTGPGTPPAWTDAAIPPTVPVSANPTALTGPTAVNGTANTWMTSDSAPAVNLGATYNWTGPHNYLAGNLTIAGVALKAPLTGSTTVAGALIAVGACLTNTASITGATTAMAVVATPTTDPGAVSWFAFVSSANTVTVKECALVLITPASITYNIRVIQ